MNRIVGGSMERKDQLPIDRTERAADKGKRAGTRGDAVGGEGVENIASSGDSAGQDTGTRPAATNETARSEQMRDDEGTEGIRY
jgi:hypothetical protein